MLRYKIKISRGFIFLIVFITNGLLKSQNLSETIQLADSFYSEEKFPNALTEYRRVFFFSPDSAKYNLADKISDCYFILGKLQFAKNFCDSAIIYSLNDSTRLESTLKKNLFMILEGNTGDAILNLENTDFSFSQNIENKRNNLLGFSYFRLNDFKKSLTYFESLNQNDSVKNYEIKKIFNELLEARRINPMLAACMSAVFPGTGQIYSGQIFNGINSLFLLTGLTLTGYYLIPLSVVMTPVIARYYMGGISHSYRFALEKRESEYLNAEKKLVKVLAINKDYFNYHPEISNFKQYSKYLSDSDTESSIIISAAFLLYKGLISSQDVDACIFTPSCSVYMMETIKKNGLAKGLIDGTDRLLRCHGFASHNHYETSKLTGKLYDSP